MRCKGTNYFSNKRKKSKDFSLLIIDIDFNQDISGWNVTKVKSFEDIFDNCPIKEEYKPKF